METKVIFLIVGLSVVALLFLFFLVGHFRKKKKQKAIKQRISQIEEEGKKLKEPPVVSIVDDELTIKDEKEEIKQEPVKPIIEDYEEIEIPEDVIDRLKKKNQMESESFERRKRSDDDFEDFLNEHSFTRKVLDKDMVAKLNSMPPEVRAMILGNMFNKFED